SVIVRQFSAEEPAGDQPVYGERDVLEAAVEGQRKDAAVVIEDGDIRLIPGVIVFQGHRKGFGHVPVEGRGKKENIVSSPSGVCRGESIRIVILLSIIVKGKVWFNGQ